MILYKSFRKHIKNTTIRKHVQFTSLFILPFTNFAFFNNELGYKVGYVQGLFNVENVDNITIEKSNTTSNSNFNEKDVIVKCQFKCGKK